MDIYDISLYSTDELYDIVDCSPDIGDVELEKRIVSQIHLFQQRGEEKLVRFFIDIYHSFFDVDYEGGEGGDGDDSDDGILGDDHDDDDEGGGGTGEYSVYRKQMMDEFGHGDGHHDTHDHNNDHHNDHIYDHHDDTHNYNDAHHYEDNNNNDAHNIENVEGFEGLNENELPSYDPNAGGIGAIGGGGADSDVALTFTPPAPVQLTKMMDYSKDKLNPLLKETIKRIIYIDSQFRQNRSTTKTTNFTFNLNETLKNVVSLKLYSVCIPYSWYTVNTNYGSNFFYISGITNGITNEKYEIKIASGTYTEPTLISAINTSISILNTLYPDVSFGETALYWDENTKKTQINVDIKKIYNESYYSIDFIYDVSLNQTANVGSFLGFVNSAYSFYSIRSYFKASNPLIGSGGGGSGSVLNASHPYNTTASFYLTADNSFFDVVYYLNTKIVNGVAVVGDGIYNASASTVVSRRRIYLTKTTPAYYNRNDLFANLVEVIASVSALYKIEVKRQPIVDLYQFYLSVPFLNNPQNKNIKIYIDFPVETAVGGGAGAIWTGANSCFQFYANKADVNALYAETTILKTNYPVWSSPFMYLKCVGAGGGGVGSGSGASGYGNVDLSNSFIVRVPNSAIGSAGYSMNEYINVLNQSFTNGNTYIVSNKESNVLEWKTRAIHGFSYMNSPLRFVGGVGGGEGGVVADISGISVVQFPLGNSALKNPEKKDIGTVNGGQLNEVDGSFLFNSMTFDVSYASLNVVGGSVIIPDISAISFIYSNNSYVLNNSAVFHANELYLNYGAGGVIVGGGGVGGVGAGVVRIYNGNPMKGVVSGGGITLDISRNYVEFRGGGGYGDGYNYRAVSSGAVGLDVSYNGVRGYGAGVGGAGVVLSSANIGDNKIKDTRETIREWTGMIYDISGYMDINARVLYHSGYIHDVSGVDIIDISYVDVRASALVSGGGVGSASGVGVDTVSLSNSYFELGSDAKIKGVFKNSKYFNNTNYRLLFDASSVFVRQGGMVAGTEYDIYLGDGGMTDGSSYTIYFTSPIIVKIKYTYESAYNKLFTLLPYGNGGNQGSKIDVLLSDYAEGDVIANSYQEFILNLNKNIINFSDADNGEFILSNSSLSVSATDGLLVDLVVDIKKTLATNYYDLTFCDLSCDVMNWSSSPTYYYSVADFSGNTAMVEAWKGVQLKNTWYDYFKLDPSFQSLATSYNTQTISTTVYSANSITGNTIIVSGANGNNQFLISPLTDNTGVSVDGNILYTIPDGEYTRELLLNTLNTVIATQNKPATRNDPNITSSYFTLYEEDYVKFVPIIQKLYCSYDYKLIFYDTVNFVYCYLGYSGNNTQNTTWDSTLGWILGFRDSTEYTINPDYIGSGGSGSVGVSGAVVEGLYLNTRTVMSVATDTDGFFPITPPYFISDTTLSINIYTYFFIILDDYNLNHLNDGLVTITQPTDNIPLPSYSALSSRVCDPITGELTFVENTNNRGNGMGTGGSEGGGGGLTQKQLYALNEAKQSQKNKVKSYSAGPFIKDVFGHINIKPPKTGDVHYVEFGGSLQNQERIYFGPVNIQRMSIKLLTDRGDVIDLNNSDWSFSFICESLYNPSA